MIQPTDRQMHNGRVAGAPHGGAARAALWLLACGLLGLGGVAQGQPTDLTLANVNITSGSASYTATHSITAGPAFTVSGSASVSFTAGSYIVLNPGFQATAGSAPVTFQAGIGVMPVAVVIATNPAGQQVTVDGASYAAPQTFNWTPGTAHSVSAAASISGTGMQGTFSGWSDGGAAAHTITVGAAGGTYTATYTAQYYLTTAVSGPGTVTPSSGWYAAGAQVNLTATANTGSQFQGFTGTVSGSNSTLTVTMNGPATETAQFGAPAGFSMTVAAMTPTSIFLGESASYMVSLTPANGFTGQVSLAVSGLPQGAMVFGPSSPVTISGAGTVTSAFTVKIYQDSFRGQCQLTVTATGPGGATQTGTAPLTVGPAPVFTIAPLPTQNPYGWQIVQQGAPMVYTVLPPAGYGGTIQLGGVNATCQIDPQPGAWGVNALGTGNADGSLTVTVTEDLSDGGFNFLKSPCATESFQHYTNPPTVLLYLTITVYGSNPSTSPQTFYNMGLAVESAPAISLAVSLLSQMSGSATYLAAVNTTGYTGPVTLGLQAGSCAKLMGTPPTVSVPSSPGAKISVLTAGCAPGTSTALTFTAAGTGVQADPQTVGLKTFPVAAVLASPVPGATIPGGATAFTWSAVANATAYSLAVGSSPGGADYYSGPGPSGVSVNLPASGVVYATLGTQVRGVWQYQQSVNTVNPSPATAPLVASGTAVAGEMPRGNVKLRQTYYFSGGDPTTISSVSTNVSGFTARLVGVTHSTATIEYQADSSVPSGGQPIVTMMTPAGPMWDPAPVPIQMFPPDISVSPQSAPVNQPIAISGTSDPPPNYQATGVIVIGTSPWDAIQTIWGSSDASGTFSTSVPGIYFATFWVYDNQGKVLGVSMTISFFVEAPPPGGTISGQVTSTVDNTGVPGVTISVSSGPTATTDSNGSYTVSVNSTNDTVTPSKTGYTFNPTSQQANVSSGVPLNFTATPTGTVPNITAISPNSVTQADANNDSIVYGVYGTNLVSSNASGVVFLDANGNPDSTITFAVTQQDDSLIQGTIALASNVQGGAHSFYVASPNGNSNTLTLTVQGDLTPHIDTVQPTGLTAGVPTQVTISGMNFGTGCGANTNTPCTSAVLDVCVSGAAPPCSSSISIASIDEWTDTEIRATLNAATSGAFEVVVGSAGSTGNGFFAAPNGKGKWSNPQQLVVNGNANLQLVVTSQTNGGPVLTLSDPSSNLCAYVDENYNLPQIKAAIVSKDASPVSGSAQWSLSVSRSYVRWANPATRVGGTVSDTDGYSTSWSAFQPASQEWTAPGPADGNVHLGYGYIYWNYSPYGDAPWTNQPTFQFKICGTNPDATATTSFPTVDAGLSSTGYWFARNFALHETNMSEFCQQSVQRNSGSDYCAPVRNDGMTTFNANVHGYGMMQLDPAFSYDDLWNWNTNLADWVTLTQHRLGPTHWPQQVDAWTKYNANLPAGKAPAPLPPDVVYGDTSGNPAACRFAVSASNPKGQPPSGYSFADADVIKETGGIAYCWPDPGCRKSSDEHGETIMFIRWQKDHLYVNEDPHWQVFPNNTISQDLVKEICSCTGPPRNCLSRVLPANPSPPPPGCYPGVTGYPNCVKPQ